MDTLVDDTSWVLGAKNIDEDPLFSQYYLSDCIEVYGAARAFYSDFTEAYYVPAKEAALVSRRNTQKAVKNPKWLRQNSSAMQAQLQSMEQFLDRHPTYKLSTLDFHAIGKLYLAQQRLSKRLYRLSRLPQTLDRGTDYFTNYLIERLRAYSGNDTYSHFALLTSPRGISRFEQVELRENEIANSFFRSAQPIIKKSRMHATSAQLTAVAELSREFEHIVYHGYGDRTILTPDKFWNRIQRKINRGIMLPSMKDKLAARAQMVHEQNQLVRQLGVDSHLHDLLVLYGEIALAKINRRFTQLKNFVLLDAIIGCIAQKAGIPEVAIRFMTQGEVTNILLDQRLAPSAGRKASKRIQASVWIYDAEGVHISVGQENYQSMLKATAGEPRCRASLDGTPACIGPTVHARARLVFRAEDEFAKGEILVSEATDPDLIGQMRKAAAILTEQGGVTSHASILAREQHVPCIIGVKDLLNSVKDGDVLIVNTQQGTIKNLGQHAKNIVSVSQLEQCTIEEFGGKAYGLLKLKAIGYGSYLPKTYFVKHTFSTANDNDLTDLAHVVTSLKPRKLAIRSSSILEDRESQSWAGQFPTFLRVDPDIATAQARLEELLQWQPAEADARSTEPTMRAIIQEQIDAVISGTCFTKHPVTDDRSLVVMELTHGLGDKLVSGKTIPSQLIYSKTHDEFMDTTAIGEGLTSASRQAFIDLVRVALHAEQSWQKPVDIEFAIDANNHLKLLQCRPITA